MTSHARTNQATSPPILIAGIGNIFLGDDAFGVEVVRRLRQQALPPGVRLVDFGIRGIDLSLALIDDSDEAVILVDATSRGASPGTLYLIEPEWEVPALQDDGIGISLEAHSLDPARVLRVVAALGGPRKRVWLVGCEPTMPDLDDDPPIGLSPVVRAAIDEAVHMVEDLVTRIRSAGTAHETPIASHQRLELPGNRGGQRP